MRISDWSSDVCSSDLLVQGRGQFLFLAAGGCLNGQAEHRFGIVQWRSEEHTSELQSLMRISYAVFCLKKKKEKSKKLINNDYTHTMIQTQKTYTHKHEQSDKTKNTERL